MALTEGIIFGIVAALSWGTGDFIAKFAVDRLGSRRTVFWVQVFGFIALLPLLAIFPSAASGSASVLPLVVLIGVLNAIAWVSFYRGFEVGRVSVVCPIAGTASALTAVLGIGLLGERLGFLQGAGVLLAMLGIVLSSIDVKELRSGKGKPVSRGVPEALIALFCWGTMWFLVVVAEGAAGWLAIILGLKCVTIVLSGAYARARGGIMLPSKTGLWLWGALAVAGVFDAAGFAALSFALTSEFASLVTPVSHAYPAVTVLLALWILKERPSPSQLLGVAAIILGVVALSL